MSDSHIPSESNQNFIHDFIDEDLQEGQRSHGKQIHTRFPPEPNGFLHIGHAKAICINFSTAEKYQGLCNLRMDDTNPVKEDERYVKAIMEDVRWLGYDWEDRFYHASDYFEQMYHYAEDLIQKDLAFVCEQSQEEIRESRGTLTEAGTNSPWRNRPKEESLALFRQMRAGAFEDGRYTLRAKIDMASGNINMRDPVLYRIARQYHHRSKDAWCIYPMYDYAHPIEDGIEEITHSLCSLEFESHRPLYNWVVDNLDLPAKPRQIEFARLNLDYTVMSKRKLRTLVEEGLVTGWDDPRMPTLSGLRRRGYTPASIRNFCDRIGVSKVDSLVSHDFLEFCLREDLNAHAPRAMAVIDPIKLKIVNYPEGQSEMLPTENHPGDPEMGEREVSFSRELWIERSDYEDVPPRKYRRLYPGNEVRLKSAYIVRCLGAVRDEAGEILYVEAEYDPETRGGTTPDGRKVRGTIHWVDAETAVDATLHLYDRLFTVPEPEADGADYHDFVNPKALEVKAHAKLEASLKDQEDHKAFQFMRQGYFVYDAKSTQEEGALVYNRAVSLKESYKPKA